MKKIIFIILCCIATLLSAGCTKENATTTKSPKISIKLVSEVPATVYPGDTLNFAFALSYDKGLSISVASADGKELDGTKKTYASGVTQDTVKFSYIPQSAYSGNTIDFAVMATAPDGTGGHYDVPVFILASKSQIVVNIPKDAPDSFEVSGDSLAFMISIVSANVDMKHVNTYKGETKMDNMSFDVTGDLRKTNFRFAYLPTLGDTGAATVFTFEVMDVNGNLTNAYYSVTFFKAPSSELDEYTGVIMGMNKCTAAGQFANLYDGEIYQASGVGEKCASVDFVVFWSNNQGTQGTAFASPAVSNVTSIYTEPTITSLGGTVNDIPANWKVRNRTTFREVDMTADQYAAVDSVATLVRLYETGTVPANEQVTFRKAKGSVVVFCASRYQVDPQTGEPVVDPQTGEKIIETSRYGIIRVAARQATNNTGTITLDYKIEK